MSSDKTAVEDSEDNVSSGSDSDHPAMNHTTKEKKLIKHRLSWRRWELQQMIDRKVTRRRTPRGQSMCLEMVKGRVSTRPKPANIPEWAEELFDNDN